MKGYQLDIPTPLAPIRLQADDLGLLRSLRFLDTQSPVPEPEELDPSAPLGIRTLYEAYSQLSEYFSGTRRYFALDLPQHRGFAAEVYKAIEEIPPGETASYSEIARRLGKPRAARAVGGALARNELLIIIPCHRVVPATGGCGAYRDGAKIKNALLSLEKQRFSL